MEKCVKTDMNESDLWWSVQSSQTDFGFTCQPKNRIHCQKNNRDFLTFCIYMFCLVG